MAAGRDGRRAAAANRGELRRANRAATSSLSPLQAATSSLSLSSALASAPDGELTRARSTRGRRAALAEVDVRRRAGSADPADGEQGDAAVAREPTTLADARRDRRRPLETFSFCETRFFSVLSSNGIQMQNLPGDGLRPPNVELHFSVRL
jgi:hypothetical protein